MPDYYVQKFENRANGGETTCYGEQGAHNHDKSNQFTTDVTTWLTQAPANWNRADISARPFLSGQPEPAGGKKFRWDNTNNRWVKV